MRNKNVRHGIFGWGKAEMRNNLLTVPDLMRVSQMAADVTCAAEIADGRSGERRA